MDILQQFLGAVGGILFLFGVAVAIGRGIKKDDDDFDGMAQVYCASKDMDGRRLAALGNSQ